TGRVLVAESGTVQGGIEATDIAIAGEVRGDLTASDGVEVQASGRVEGNIEAPRVGIEAGARVRGMLRTGVELKSNERDKDAAPDKNALRKETKKADLPPRASDHPKAAAAQGNGAAKGAPEKPTRRDEQSDSSGPAAENRKALKRKRPRRNKGPPAPPTFVKGAHGRTK